MELRNHLDDLSSFLLAEIERIYGEPHGRCAEAAVFVYTVLRAEGHDALIKCGHYEWHDPDLHEPGDVEYAPHAWVVCEGLVCDPTRWQFDHGAPLVLAPQEEGYELYNDSRRWHGPDERPTEAEAFEFLGDWYAAALATLLSNELEALKGGQPALA